MTMFSPMLVAQILDECVSHVSGEFIVDWRLMNCLYCVFFQAEVGMRDLVRSRGLGDVYKRQSSARVELTKTRRRWSGVRIMAA